MHIGEQILNVLLVQGLAVAGHFTAPEANNVGHAFIVGGKAAQGKILVLENTLEPGAFLPSRGIGLVTAIAVGVVYPASGGLLRIESKFRVRFASFHFASAKHRDQRRKQKRRERGRDESPSASPLPQTSIGQ